jgi:O-antigen ligase
MSPSARRLGLLLVAALVGVGFALLVHYGSLRSQVPFQGYLVFSLATSLGLLAALAYIAWKVEPAWLLTGAFLAAAFNGNWGAVGFPAMFAPDRLLMLAGIAAILARSPGARGLPRFRFEPVHALLLAMVAWAVGSAIAAETLGKSETIFILFDRFTVPFLVFTLAPLAFHEPRHRRGLLLALVCFGAYLGLTAIFEVIGPRFLVFPRYILDASYGYHSERARGPFVEATAYGVGLYVSAVAAAVALATWRTRGKRIFAAGVLAACALGLLLTLTRSVWLATVIASLVALVAVPGLRRFLVPAAIGLAAMVLVALAAVPGLDGSVQDRADSNRPVWERENVNAAALNMVSDRPLLGFGLDTFTERNRDYFQLLDHTPQVAILKIGIHNVFLDLAVELGLIGAGLFVACLLVAVGGALLSRGPPEIGPWKAGLLAVTVFWIVVANFAPTGQVYPSLVVWLWAGVVMSGSLAAEPAAAPRTARASPRLAYARSE